MKQREVPFLILFSHVVMFKDILHLKFNALSYHCGYVRGSNDAEKCQEGATIAGFSLPVGHF